MKKFKKATVKKSKKKSIDFQAIQKSFTSLDPQNMGGWPIIVKLTIFMMVFVIVVALAYSIPIQEKITDISSSEAKQATLLTEFEEKEAKARNLGVYKVQIEQMNASFAQLLEQLPKETKIPDLVEDINMKGVRSDIQFKNIAVNDEVTKPLFIERPIVIESQGEYHKFANFVSSVASLPRIITIHDFTITNTAKDHNNSLPILDVRVIAKTYRAKTVKPKPAETTETTEKP